MPFRQFAGSVSESVRGAVGVIKDTLVTLKDYPEIAAYPYIATAFMFITYPIIGTTIFARWYSRIFSDVGAVAPHKIRIIIGLVGFSAFYTALVVAYFSCMVSVSVIAKLEGRKIPPFYGFMRVIKNFFRVTRFALLSVFFFPVGVYAQRGKLPDGWIGVFGSSFTLHMAQVAPTVLTTNKKFGATLRESIDVLGRAWREGLVLKVGSYIGIFLVVALPKLIQHGFFKGHTASDVGWLISLELATSGLVAFKVINAIFTSVLYHQAKNKST